MALEESSLVNTQEKIWRTSRKLQAYGALLTRQMDDPHGFLELEGMGLDLCEMGEQLEAVSSLLKDCPAKAE